MEAEELKSPFEAIKQTDKNGKEWWNSRQLAKVMGYTKYWNFERLIDKVAHALQVERGLSRSEHFCEIEEMAHLGNGTSRRVTSLLLSRAACMGIACNADQRKPMVKMAREYFQGAMTGNELAKGMEGNVLIYRSSTGKVNVSVLFNQDTFWLSQKRMAELFGTAVSTINYHLKQIDESGEVHLSDAIRKIRIPSEQWDEQGVTLYNLDVVIAVGYRVNSYEATQFRIWSAKYDRANADKPYMGLTTWKNAPDGRIRKSDVTVAKNYLSEQEIHSLELLSTAFVDMAELRAERHQLMSMKDWKEQLVKFLSFNDRDILPDAGRISHEQAEEKAFGEYEKYRLIQDRTFLSDFDKLLNDIK